MPASMISAPIGGSPKVTGSSMVMVAIGPMPGSTPISVPTRHPRKHSPRVDRGKATENPSERGGGRARLAPPPRHPRKHSPRLARVKATESPSERWARSSLIARTSQDHPSRDDEDGNRQVQQRAEEQDAPDGHGHGEDGQLAPASLGRRRPRHEDRGRARPRPPRDHAG